MESLKGKNVLIIGATGGIGSKTARLLAGSGANLFLAARNKEKLQLLGDELKLSEGKIFALDISNPGEVALLKENFFSQYATIDILLNAAGIGVIKSIDELTETEFLQTINYNLYGPFLLLKAFLPGLFIASDRAKKRILK